MPDNAKGRRSLVAKAGDSVTISFGGWGVSRPIARGDWLFIAGLKQPWAVWHNDGHTITVARGWRLWYLRLLYNSIRRLLRFCVNVFALVFER